MLLVSSGVHASEVACIVQLPVAGVKCIVYPVLYRKRSLCIAHWKFQNMLNPVHVVEKEFSTSAKLFGIAQPRLENPVPPYLSLVFNVEDQSIRSIHIQGCTACLSQIL